MSSIRSKLKAWRRFSWLYIFWKNGYFYFVTYWGPKASRRAHRAPGAQRASTALRRSEKEGGNRHPEPSCLHKCIKALWTYLHKCIKTLQMYKAFCMQMHVLIKVKYIPNVSYFVKLGHKHKIIVKIRNNIDPKTINWFLGPNKGFKVFVDP